MRTRRDTRSRLAPARHSLESPLAAGPRHYAAVQSPDTYRKSRELEGWSPPGSRVPNPTITHWTARSLRQPCWGAAREPEVGVSPAATWDAAGKNGSRHLECGFQSLVPPSCVIVRKWESAVGCEFWTGGTARCVHLAPSEVVEIPVTESFAAVSKTFPGRSPDFGHLG